jgi:hypothetical protein
MERHNRGSKVPITTIFYDSSGDIAQPTSASIVISYPSGTTGADWPFDGDTQMTTSTSLASVSTLLGTWATTWDSAVSARGMITWSAYPSNLSFGVNEGRFLLRGNLSNLYTSTV